ncbi:MAG TPA: hypothetical protein VGP07_22775 [Polyangia bacterium]|jgi:hypothetical protein
MKSRKALRELKQYLRRAGDEYTPNTPRAGIEKMASFYNDVRVDDVDLESDGDMLLFQWGTYDWGDGPTFEVGITRQLIRGTGEDDEIWQLHLTYRFPPSEALVAIGDGDCWCTRPAEAASFVQVMMAHPVIAAVGSRDDGLARLEYECAG